jgi:hypothetical protein
VLLRFLPLFGRFCHNADRRRSTFLPIAPEFIWRSSALSLSVQLKKPTNYSSRTTGFEPQIPQYTNRRTFIAALGGAVAWPLGGAR